MNFRLSNHWATRLSEVTQASTNGADPLSQVNIAHKAPVNGKTRVVKIANSILETSATSGLPCLEPLVSHSTHPWMFKAMKMTWRMASPKSRCWTNKTKKHPQLSIPHGKFHIYLQTTSHTQIIPLRKPASSHGEKVSSMDVVSWFQTLSSSISIPSWSLLLLWF